MNIKTLTALKLAAVVLTGSLTFLAPISRAATFVLTEATTQDINAAFTAGALTSEQLTKLYLARIAAYDQAGPKLNAVIYANDQALATARALDAERKAGKVRGPLHGIPVLVKDNYDTFDMPTTGGALALKGAIPAHDAFMVKKLRDAGAVIIAKVNMDEMARGGNGVSSLGGQTLNPHALGLIPGGSSAGTVRHPANDCNIVGMVATEGLLSRAGIMPISMSQDRGGPMTLSVYDTAVMLSVMAGVDPNDQITRLSIGKTPSAPYESFLKPDSLKGKRLGVLRDLYKPGAEHEEYNKLILDGIEAMKKAGAVIVDPVSSVVSPVALVTSISSEPSPLIVPAKTSSPGFLSTGTDSPVIGAWLTADSPVSTTPSRGILMPDRVATVSPTVT